MPKLDLTPWQPSAVFRPFTLLCMRKPDAELVNEVNNPGFNQPVQSGAILPMWRAGADKANMLIRLSMLRAQPRK